MLYQKRGQNPNLNYDFDAGGSLKIKVNEGLRKFNLRSQRTQNLGRHALPILGGLKLNEILFLDLSVFCVIIVPVRYVVQNFLPCF